jgi:predicted amidohydrolase
MKIAMAQMKMSGAIEENFEKSLSMIEEAASGGADLIFFPEVQFYPFFPQYPNRRVEEYALTLEHTYIRQIMALCEKRHIMASPNLYLREGDACYDASLFIGADGRLQDVSKMVHIMQCPFFYEQNYYAPSDEGFRVYEMPFGNVGVVICFDRHLPESVRTCAVLGADLILIPTANTQEEPLELFEWEIRVQAMHSSVYIAMCNRVGQEEAMTFAGQSLVADFRGGIVVRSDGSERLIYADVDLEKSRAARRESPYFKLRKPQFYKQ